jgi:predicted ATP-dependent endonuclease of OLD family
VVFNQAIDQYVDVKIISSGRTVPLDLAGTGFLQAIQILAYLHLFSPKLIVLDEPDSHLHPNNQGLLCSLLRMIALEREVQVIMTTHSRAGTCWNGCQRPTNTRNGRHGNHC